MSRWMLKRWIVSSLLPLARIPFDDTVRHLTHPWWELSLNFWVNFWKEKATCHEESQGRRGRNWRKYVVKYDWGRKKTHCKIRLTKEASWLESFSNSYPATRPSYDPKAICIVILYYSTVSKCMKTICSSGIRESENKIEKWSELRNTVTRQSIKQSIGFVATAPGFSHPISVTCGPVLSRFRSVNLCVQSINRWTPSPFLLDGFFNRTADFTLKFFVSIISSADYFLLIVFFLYPIFSLIFRNNHAESLVRDTEGDEERNETVSAGRCRFWGTRFVILPFFLDVTCYMTECDSGVCCAIFARSIFQESSLIATLVSTSSRIPSCSTRSWKKFVFIFRTSSTHLIALN